MKFTFSWLKDHLETKLNFNQISEILTNVGLEVENIQDKSKDFKNFTVAYVIKAEKHPNADRLKVCEVQTNKGSLQVVCGAPNAKTGMKGIFAPVGSFIPGTSVQLKKTEIRGVSSEGMLLSEKEVGISDDHEGIIQVDDSCKIGDTFSKVFGFDDVIIEIGITPNRSDCLSVRGIARDLAAAGAGKLKKINYKSHKGKFVSPIKWKISLNKKNAHLCPSVAGIYFKNVKNSQSPEWLKKRLIAIGLRPISTLVDITNYITYDLGRPLHVFDADKIKGNLVMRLAKKNESIKALDGKTYNLLENMVVISDDKQAHAIGGVMGGEDSSCSEETLNVFLEVALFDPVSISRTGRNLDLQSDARFRFERGIDPYSIEFGINAAIKMILNLCGGEASKLTIDGNYKKPEKILEYDFDRVKTLGGINIKINHQKKILNSLGFTFKKIKNNKTKIKVPSYRPDIEGEADLVEEVLRIFGYDKIVEKSVIKRPEDFLKPLKANQLVFYKSKRIIASRGYFEVVTWSFMSSKFAEYFNQYENILKLDNPISSDLDVMRPSIIPNLLESITKNQARLFHNAGMFEIGPQYENYIDKGQHMVASGIKYGSFNSSNWNDDDRAVDTFDIKADIFSFFSSLDIPIDNLKIDYEAPNWYHPGKSATLRLGNNILGFFGEINPITLNIYEIKTNVCAFEIFLEDLWKFQSKKSFSKILYDNNPYQSVERDFSFIINKNIKSSDITDIIRRTEKELIKEIKIFDVFEGENIPADKKSIAIRIILQPILSTFTDQDIEKITEKIINNVCKNIGAEIRK